MANRFFVSEKTVKRGMNEVQALKIFAGEWNRLIAILVFSNLRNFRIRHFQYFFNKISNIHWDIAVLIFL